MSRLVAAVATFTISATLLAGVTYAETKHEQQQRKARIAKMPKKPVVKQSADDFDELTNKMMPVKSFGGY
jgi:hypothetical protein